MNHRRTSFAFLMEMLWVCGFFILSSCVFILAFVKADQLSRRASNLNQAVVAVENAVESTFSLYSAPLPDGTQEQTELYFDSSWTAESILAYDSSSGAGSGRTHGSGADSDSALFSGSGAGSGSASAYRITIHTSWQDGLLTVRASAFDDTKASDHPEPSGSGHSESSERTEALFSLEGIRYYPPQAGEGSAE